MTEQEIELAIDQAAQLLGAKSTDVWSYYTCGGDWNAGNPAELAELIVECWEEQRAQRK